MYDLWREFLFISIGLAAWKLAYVNITGPRIKKFFKQSDDEFIF